MAYPVNERPTDNLCDVLLRALEQSPSVVVITDLDSHIEYVNPVFCRLTGYTREEVIGQHVCFLKSGQMSPEIYAALWRQLKAGADWSGEFHNRKKNGDLYWEAATISPVRDAHGVTEHYLKVAEDITRRKAAETELKEAQERYARVVMALRGFMFTVLLDSDGHPVRTLYYAGTELVTGYTVPEYQADPLLWYRMIVEEDRAPVTEQIEAVLKGKTTRGIEHRIRHKNGSVRWVRNLSVPTLDAQGRMTAYDGLITDITELKEAQALREELLAQMRRMALRDPLTGLYSRRGFEEELQRAWLLGERRALPTGVLILDLDHFKVLNDTYGHTVGDQVLIETARLIMDTVRAADIVSRHGGDEMVVILPLTNAEETRQAAGRLLEAFGAHTFCRGTHDLRATISIGAACGSAADPTAQHILMRADQALYRAKQLGRNRVCVSEPDGASAFGGSWEPFADAASGVIPTNDSGLSSGTILVVDDDAAVRHLLHTILEKGNYAVATAASAEQAKQIANHERGRIDVAIVDVRLPDGSGLDVLRQLRLTDDAIVGVTMTGFATVAEATEALRAGASDFVTKPFSADALRVVVDRAMRYRRLLQENRSYQRHLENMVAERSAALTRALAQVKQSYRSTLEVVAAMLGVRENKTGEHCKRVAFMAETLAREMKLSDQDVEMIGHSALLHDIGKIAMPDAILQKKGPLTEAEWIVMKSHPRIGYEIVSGCAALETASDIVYSHQERFDGKGYPRGLKGTEICLGARIFAVVDTYDAIRSDRPYSRSLSVETAISEIVAGRGTQFDPDVVDAFLRCQPRIESYVSEG